MLQRLMKLGGTFALAMLLIVLATSTNGTAADEVPTIKDIMKKGHEKTDGYIAKIKGAAKDGKWDDAAEYAKTLAFFGENLGKNKPPKGDEDSWKKMSAAYAESTKAVLKAVQAKDAKAVAKSLGTINCGGCHKAHR